MERTHGGTARHLYAPGHEPAEGVWGQVTQAAEVVLPLLLPLMLAALVVGLFRLAFAVAERRQARRARARRRARTCALLDQLEAEACEQAEERRRRGYLAADLRRHRRDVCRAGPARAVASKTVRA